MPSQGASRGHPKWGGRQKGSPNKRTLELARQAHEEAAALKAKGELYKFGKDRAKEVDDIAFEVAMAFQPEVKDGVASWAKPEDEVRFERYLRLSLDAAKARAPYESPRYMAVGVVAPGMDNSQQQEVRRDPREVLWETYLGMRERGELALKTVPAPEAKASDAAPASEPVPVVQDDADGVAV